MNRFVSVPVALALAATCFAQGKTWIVDAAMGAGAHYRDIPAAVAKAVDGDKIIVRKGAYSHFNLTRGVAIIGETGARVWSYGTSVISGLPVGRTAAVQNLEVFQIDARDCKGPVILNHVKAARIAAQRSSQVYVSESRSYMLFASSSTVSVTNTEIVADTTGQSWAVIFDTGARVTMAGCRVTGGQFYTFALPTVTIDATSVLTLTGDGSSFVQLTPNWKSRAGTPVIDGSGTLVLDPRVILRTTNASPTIAKGVKVTRRTVPFLNARGAPLGGTVNVTLKAGANHPFYLAIGLPGHVTSFPSLGGLVWLDLNTAILIATGKLDAKGAYTWSIRVPKDYVLLGLSLVWQGTAGPSLTQQSLSNPSAYVHGY